MLMGLTVKLSAILFKNKKNIFITELISAENKKLGVLHLEVAEIYLHTASLPHR